MTNAIAISSIALTVLSLLTTSVLVVGSGTVELALGTASIIVTVLELVHKARATPASHVPVGPEGSG
ncbi:MAG: hypothetical protein ABL907_05505, partial [Hyphomicrobium sp.]